MSASFFAAAFAVTDPIQDAVYGEDFLIEPRIRKTGDANARRSADPARPAQTITGTWTDPHAQVYPHNRTRHPDADSARVGDDKPTMDFVTAALPYTLVIGDLVTRVSTGSRHAISDVSDDGFTRTTVGLTAGS